MRTSNGTKRKGGARKIEAQSASPRFSIPLGVTQGIAYAMIGLAVLLSWFITPIPVAAGLTILAAIRIVIAVREAKRQESDSESSRGKGEICSARG